MNYRHEVQDMVVGLEHLKGFFWSHVQDIGKVTYECGYCGAYVGSENGFNASPATRGGSHHLHAAAVAICPMCHCPSLFYWNDDERIQFPLPAPGRSVLYLPNDLRQLYEEARASASAGAYTATVLLCRKMLMNMAVAEGAHAGKSFLHYVDFLCDQGYVPPKGRPWVDYIRTRGNEATHEIQLMTKDEALKLLSFIEMLLRFIYEFPHVVGQGAEQATE